MAPVEGLRVAIRRVYVIELDYAAGKRRDPRIPWVYVGSSSRSPDQRFEQHLSGYKSARLVKRFAKRLRPDLYADLDPVRGGSKAAVRAEKTRARELARAGFVAHCDGVSYGEGSGDWLEWGEARIEPVASYVDEAAAELFEASFSPLDPERCVELLRGERGFWLAEHIDVEDPPPAFGMFAHVSASALLRRVRPLAPEPA
jgi:hypothetical protein